MGKKENLKDKIKMDKNEKVSIKDAKGKVKSFFALLKHLKKDPVNNVKEVEERQKEAKPVLIIGAIIAIAGGIISFIGSLLGEVIAVVGMIFSGIGYAITFAGLIILIFWLYIWLRVTSAKKRFKDLECPNCGETIEDEKATYEELEKYTRTTSDNKHSYLTEYTKVKINCKCQKCGTEKSFTTDFATDRYVDGEHRKTDSVEVQVARYLFSRTLQ